jgi:outer membrane protein
MNRNLTLLTALGAGLALAPTFAVAQAPAAAAPAPAAAPAAAQQAVVAKIALINFQQVVLASNEGQTVTLNTQKKYEPQKTEIEKLSAEVKQKQEAVQKLPATTPDAERASKLNEIDRLEKKLNAEAQEASDQYNAEWQEALGKVAQKIAQVVNSYADTNGYTLVLDVSGQQNNVFWASDKAHQDISQAVVDVYNKQSGIPAPAPQAPSAPRPATAPKPATTPHK